MMVTRWPCAKAIGSCPAPIRRPSPRRYKTGLYNLAEDIGERHDLSAAEPDKLKELQLKWDQWNASNVKPRWGNPSKDES